MKSLSTKPYKGTRDFYPEDMRIQQWMFKHLRSVAESYGYQEYDGPMLESLELYAAKPGEEIVNTQLYSFEDRGGRKVAMRPEMTPTLARMVAGQVNELPKPVRWFSFPNLWRYERPQRGRLREHWQFNLDILGGDPLLADAEVLQLAYDVVDGFNGADRVQIHVNNRRLVDHFLAVPLGLQPEQALKVCKAIDAKNKISPEQFDNLLIEAGVDASKVNELKEFFEKDFQTLSKEYPCEGITEIETVMQSLQDQQLGEVVRFDPQIMRGMDYYTGTVFEMYDTSPENNRAMFGGGRYDNLVGLFGKNTLSGVGFGMGDVTLRNFLETHDLLPKFDSWHDFFITMTGSEDVGRGQKISRALRKQGFKVLQSIHQSKLGQQLKIADKHQAKFAVIFGESEWNEGKVVFKNLLTGQQTVRPVDDILSADRLNLEDTASGTEQNN